VAENGEFKGAVKVSIESLKEDVNDINGRLRNVERDCTKIKAYGGVMVFTAPILANFLGDWLF
jgi:hypothetical protein